MPNTSAQKVVAIILIVIAAVLFLWGVSILMMPAMMGSMMGGGMMGSMGGCAMCAVGTFLLAAILLVLGIVVLRIKL